MSPDAAGAASVLQRGGIVVIPTDTVYGVAARIDNPDGVAKLFEAKARDPNLSIPILVAGENSAELFGELTPTARRLADRFWPGPLTLVVSRVDGFDADLGSDQETVGLRVPNNPFCLSLLERAGPLAATSANLSGYPTPRSIEEIRNVFAESVDLYIDGGPVRENRPSTVVSVVGDPALLREGVIGWDEIRQVL